MLRVSDRFLARYMRDTDLASMAVYLAWERCYRDWLDRRARARTRVKSSIRTCRKPAPDNSAGAVLTGMPRVLGHRRASRGIPRDPRLSFARPVLFLARYRVRERRGYAARPDATIIHLVNIIQITLPRRDKRCWPAH